MKRNMNAFLALFGVSFSVLAHASQSPEAKITLFQYNSGDAVVCGSVENAASAQRYIVSISTSNSIAGPRQFSTLTNNKSEFCLVITTNDIRGKSLRATVEEL